MAFDPCMIDHDYQSWEQTTTYGDEQWNHAQYHHNILFDRPFLSDGPQAPLDRFLMEDDRPWFPPILTDRHTSGHAIQSLEVGALPHLDSIPCHYNGLQRLGSPTTVGRSSSNVSSNWSDRQTTPLSSPGPSMAAYSPSMPIADRVLYTHGGQAQPVGDAHAMINGHCVALHDIQYTADELPEQTNFEDDHQLSVYASFPQEGYQPMEPEVEMQTNGHLVVGTPDNRDNHRSESPNLRHRRPQPTRTVTSPRAPQKVTKRSTTTRRPSSSHNKTKACNGDSHSSSASNSAFPCPFVIYGCPSTFRSKNEWKRHVNTQHMRTEYWRCDQCNQEDRKPNDFNRKDLFIQHVRRMHPPSNAKPTKTKLATQKSSRADPDERELASIAHRCFRRIRTPPEESGCLFCDQRFNGANTWDERLEHIGRHMESKKKSSNEPVDPSGWQEDVALHDWLQKEGIIARDGKSWTLIEARG